jgi:putative addiction module component (TIGR02574 family)
MTRNAVLQEALQLSPGDRADVAAELIVSLDDARPDDSEEVQRAWASEIDRRARRVLAGESTGASWNEVRASIERRLARR